MKKYLLIVTICCLFSLNSNSQSQEEISRDWTSFSQFIEIESKTTKKFKVVGFVKVETDDANAWAGVWARIDNNGEEMGFFDNMGNRPITSNSWQSYTVEGVINSDSRRLNFGGLCLFNGKFYFDKFELYIENDNGILEQVEIDNPSFESDITNNTIPRWSEGVSKGKVIRVKEYTISNATDAVDGKSALVIEAKSIEKEESNFGTIGNVEGASPQIGSMISMLEDLKSRVERTVSGLSQYQLDHLHDEKANRIGALIMHLAAAEKLYQVLTFEGRQFNEEETEMWADALNLDKGGRDKFKGHDIKFYLSAYDEVRKVTIEELKKRDDEWFSEMQPGIGISNHYSWFHVMEHQSSHLGQILFLKKRIPPEETIQLEEKIKN